VCSGICVVEFEFLVWCIIVNFVSVVLCKEGVGFDLSIVFVVFVVS